MYVLLKRVKIMSNTNIFRFVKDRSAQFDSVLKCCLFILRDVWFFFFVACRHDLRCSLFPTFSKKTFLFNFAESFMFHNVNNKFYFKLILKRTKPVYQNGYP